MEKLWACKVGASRLTILFYSCSMYITIIHYWTFNKASYGLLLTFPFFHKDIDSPRALAVPCTHVPTYIYTHAYKRERSTATKAAPPIYTRGTFSLLSFGVYGINSNLKHSNDVNAQRTNVTCPMRNKAKHTSSPAILQRFLVISYKTKILPARPTAKRIRRKRAT